jgi:hypothetical protein
MAKKRIGLAALTNTPQPPSTEASPLARLLQQYARAVARKAATRAERELETTGGGET